MSFVVGFVSFEDRIQKNVRGRKRADSEDTSSTTDMDGRVCRSIVGMNHKMDIECSQIISYQPQL